MATHRNWKEYTLHEGISCGISGKLPVLRLSFLLFLILIFSPAPPNCFQFKLGEQNWKV